VPDLPSGRTGQLRRELRLIQTAAISLGIVAPTAVLSLNGVLPAGQVGTAVPLVLVLASVMVCLVAYGFVLMTREFAHAGSVYAFAGRTLGPRAGFFAGWAIFASYACFTAGSTAEVGLFGGAFFKDIGLGSPDWIAISLVAGCVMTLLAYNEIRIVSRALLSIEGVAVGFIVLLFAVILIKLLTHSAPSGQTFSFAPFGLPASGTMAGVTWSTVFLAAVGGFISFAGFEGTATLGEESLEPRRTIPRALIVLVLSMASFFTIGFFIQTLGFGLDKAGVQRFAGSGNSLADLAQLYVGGAMRDVMSFTAMLSAFASALGTAIAGSRVLFAIGRDVMPQSAIGRASHRTGAPIEAIAVVMTIAFVTFIANRIAGTSAVNAFFYPATIGVLTILVAYICVTAGTLKYFFLARRLPAWPAAIPVAALALLVYVLYRQVHPVPPAPYNRFPYYAGAYLLVGLLLTVAVPGFARRIGARFAAEVKAEAAEPRPAVLT
jgi:amino acid transporter